jgi:hypothetical protein
MSLDTGLESRVYGRRDPSRDTLYPQKLALISATSSGRSVGIVRSRTKATEFVVLFMSLDIKRYLRLGYFENNSIFISHFPKAHYMQSMHTSKYLHIKKDKYNSL